MTILDLPNRTDRRAPYDDEAIRRLNLVNAHYDAENRHEVDNVMTTFGPQPTFHLNGERFEGDQAVAAAHAGLWEGFPDWTLRPLAVHVDERSIVVEATAGGTHTGPFQGIEPTGRSVSLFTCSVFDFDPDGNLTDEKVFLDVAAMLGQLGVLPS